MKVKLTHLTVFLENDIIDSELDRTFDEVLSVKEVLEELIVAVSVEIWDESVSSTVLEFREVL